MTLEFYKINQMVVTPVAAAIPDVASLLQEINTSLGTWYVAIHLANVFFFSLRSGSKDHKKQFALSQQGQQYTSTVLPQGYLQLWVMI